MDDLASPMLKLRRAYEHYCVFNEKLSTFQKDNPYTRYAESDPYSSLKITRLKVIGRPQPDPMWGTIVGDYASNLRGAMDHLVWAMSVDPKKPDLIKARAHQIKFPIHRLETPPKWEDFRANVAISLIPEAAKKIIYELQPHNSFKTRDETEIWRIRQLANADKHRTATIITDGINYRSGSALYGMSDVYIPLSGDTDPTLPTTGINESWLNSGSNLQAEPSMAVVTTEGLHIPVKGLFNLYEFVRTEVFPKFPDHFFA